MWLVLLFSVLERSFHCYKLNVLVSFVYSFNLHSFLCFNWNFHMLLLVSLLLLCLLPASDLYTTHQSSLFYLTLVENSHVEKKTNILNKKKCSLKVEQKWKAKSRAKMLGKSQNFERLFKSAFFLHVTFLRLRYFMFYSVHER